MHIYRERSNSVPIFDSVPLRGIPTLPIPKMPELNEDRLFWMKMSIMKQQKAYFMVQASLIKRK